MPSFKGYPTFADAQDAAEAVARLYAESISAQYTATGIAPLAYGPGRQPNPQESYYQPWYTDPLPARPAVPADPQNGFPAQPARPARIDVDAFAAGQDGRTVQIHGGKQVTLDFQGLQEE